MASSIESLHSGPPAPASFPFPSLLLLGVVHRLTEKTSAFALASAFWGSQANRTSDWESPLDAGRIRSRKENVVFLKLVETLEILTRLTTAEGRPSDWKQWPESVSLGQS